jgi:hypothetical protein
VNLLTAAIITKFKAVGTKSVPPLLFKINEILTAPKFNDVYKINGRLVKSLCFVFKKSRLQTSPGERDFYV